MSEITVKSRLLLRELRELMASSQNAQTRLNNITSLIASRMVAEVCSVYVAIPGERLELFSTKGLKFAAVHKTILNVGEGLVGIIAEKAQSLALSDAKLHPNFSYRPETGEEIYHSFLGVPLLRRGQTIGVLVIQNVKHRSYTEEEIEVLETIAMVIAEMISTGELGTFLAIKEIDPSHNKPHILEGLALSQGIVIGKAMLHEKRIEVLNIISEDTELENQRLIIGLEDLKRNIEKLINGLEIISNGQDKGVLEAYQMLANDQSWEKRLFEAIKKGLTAEGAVQSVQSDVKAKLLRQKNPFIKEKLYDLDDLSYRLLRHIIGDINKNSNIDLNNETILFARNMGPADLLEYSSSNIRGLVIEEASPNSHVSIVARALGIPSLGGVQNIIDMIENGDKIIIDANAGILYIRPEKKEEDLFRDKLLTQSDLKKKYDNIRNLPAITRDSSPIRLMINAGLMIDLPYLKLTNADGIGLFRTELQFMVSSRFPRLTEQETYYSAVFKEAGEKSITFRTLDIGSDKVLPYFSRKKEDNPALGWRALRFSLERPSLLKLQMRALIKASSNKDLNIIFPLVAEISEFVEAKKIFLKELNFIKLKGYSLPKSYSLGVMIEVPSLLWQLEELYEKVDFVSIGSNDLLQYLFASDRGHAQLSKRYDPISISVLRVLKKIITTAGDANIPVSLCGEIAGKPLEAMALLGLGLKNLSISPSNMGAIKSMVRSLNLEQITECMDNIFARNQYNIRDILIKFAKDNKVDIESFSWE
jgi:phosphotransferase system, enzyme I, PtsP